MPQRPPKTLRLSPELEQLISEISENENAVMRALLLIGADTLGLDLQRVQADIRRSMSGDLPPAMQERLFDMLQRSQQAAPSRIDERGTADPSDQGTSASEAEPDPFASVGFDFD